MSKPRSCLLAAALVLASATTAAAQAAPDLAAMLVQAQRFTVKVRGTVLWPFQPEQVGSATGTGFLVDRERGWILTNAHVARRSHAAVEIAVGNNEHEWIPAERMYVDNHLDVAVLKVAVDRLPGDAEAAKLGCTQRIAQGGSVVAYGHPINLNFTATRGIVSSVRTLGSQEYVQMDANINPGNSGGPLLAVETGQVVGINTANFPGAPGLGLAIAIRHVCPIVDLLAKGDDPSLPSLPVYWLKQGRTDTLTVAAPFPRYTGGNDPGLRAGDVIQSIAGGTKLASLSDLNSSLRGLRETVKLQILRGARQLDVDVPLLPARAPLKRQGLIFSGLLVTERSTLDTADTGLPSLRVEFVRPGEIASRTGFQVGDQLHQVAGQRFTSVAALYDWLKARPASEKLAIMVRRASNSDSRITAEYHRFDIAPASLQLLSEQSTQ